MEIDTTISVDISVAPKKVAEQSNTKNTKGTTMRTALQMGVRTKVGQLDVPRCCHQHVGGLQVPIHVSWTQKANGHNRDAS